MGIFRNKFLVKLIASICIFLTLLNCGVPNKVYAEDWGGILITPITKLLTSIADGITVLLHQAAMGQEVVIVEISGAEDWWDAWGKTAVKVLIVVLVIICIAATAFISGGGSAALAAGGMSAFLAGAKMVGIAALGFAAWAGINYLTVELWDGTAVELLAEKCEPWWFEDTLYMPAFSLTPEEIFSNQIPLLDINFFDPMEKQDVAVSQILKADKTTTSKNFNYNDIVSTIPENSYYGNMEDLPTINWQTEKDPYNAISDYPQTTGPLWDFYHINFEEEAGKAFKGIIHDELGIPEALITNEYTISTGFYKRDTGMPFYDENGDGINLNYGYYELYLRNSSGTLVAEFKREFIEKTLINEDPNGRTSSVFV